MAEESVLLKAEKRTLGETGGPGRLRRQGVLPGVIYGDGREPAAIQVPEQDLQNILRHHASGNVLLDLELEGEGKQKVLLKEMQHHPMSGRIIHVDFHSVSMTETLRVEIPVELTGTPVGVTQGGGVLDALLRHVEVECLPMDIIEELTVDVSALNIGDTLTVSDIPLDTSKHTIITAADVAVAAVAAPRVEEEPTEEEEGAAEGEAEGAEPEVITEKKADEETAEG
jgi:large subunit ribosomal protein L25